MLDFDLAEIYEVENRTLKQAVRRNIERFPDDFMFRLTSNESNFLINTGVSQNVIPTGYNIGSSEMYAFTREGVTMLSGVLRSPVAIQANIKIMRAFAMLHELAMRTVEVKQLAQDNAEIRQLLEEYIQETEGKFDDVYIALAQLALQRQLPPSPRRLIGFKREDRQ